VSRLSKVDGLLRPDCRAAFGQEVLPEHGPQLDPAAVAARMPRPGFLVNPSEYRQLLCRLVESVLVEFLDPARVPQHPLTGRPVVAGLFEVLKKDGAIRFILDRRPQNAIEVRLRGTPLPYAGDFTRLLLGPLDVVRTSLRDAKDFYCVLDPGDSRLPWQAFGRPVEPSWFPDCDAARAGAAQLQPCFTALMQGDHNALGDQNTLGHEKALGDQSTLGYEKALGNQNTPG